MQRSSKFAVRAIQALSAKQAAFGMRRVAAVASQSRGIFTPAFAPKSLFSTPSSSFFARSFSTEEVKVVPVPSMGDSISEGTIIKWLKAPGDSIKEDEVIVQLETDKVTVDVRSPASGVVAELLASEGAAIAVGAPLFKLAQGGAAAAAAAAAPKPAAEAPKAAPEAPKAASAPAAAPKAEAPKPAAPAAAPKPAGVPVSAGSSLAKERRVPMTRMRQRIAERLKDSQNTAAMLTTFNEVDMKALMDLRSQFKDDFEKKHGTKFGFMSAFVKAATVALQDQPSVNAVIDGTDIVYRDYVDISVAVATPTGLLVPVIRNAQDMGFAQVEKELARLADKGRKGQISIDDMQGGTFTISNGGVFGSMMGTPIINPPQSAILGMHAIKDRAVVVDGQIVIRPIMYLALTYDHRLVDGREAVTFLKKIKECIEDPRRILLDL